MATSRSNVAVAHFTGTNDKKDLKAFKEWYAFETLEYLTHLHEKQQPLLRAVLWKNEHDVVKQLHRLIQFSVKSQAPAFFITFEPAEFATSHFIMGVAWERSLLIINPIGETCHHGLYETILKLQNQPRGVLPTHIYLSTTKIQREGKGQLYEDALVSCGPICVELMAHLISLPVKDIFQQIKSKTPTKTSQAGLEYYNVDVTSLLPASLAELVKANNLPSYQAQANAIRVKHLSWLERPFPSQSTLSVDKQNELFFEHGIDHDEHEIFTDLLSGKLNISQLSNDARYQRLTANLNNLRTKPAQKSTMTATTATTTEVIEEVKASHPQAAHAAPAAKNNSKKEHQSDGKSESKNDAIALSPQSTKGGGDCAFHAAFGQLSGSSVYVCEDHATRRATVAQAIRTATVGSTVFSLRQDAIKALIMEGRSRGMGKAICNVIVKYQAYLHENSIAIGLAWDKFEQLALNNLLEECIVDWFSKQSPETQAKLNTFKAKFYACLVAHNSLLRGIILATDSLHTAFERYNAESSKDFDWNKILNESNIINEYAEFFSTPGNYLLPIELDMIANALNITIHFYTRNFNRNHTTKVVTYNPDQKQSVMVCFNGTDHYERMTEQLSLDPHRLSKKEESKKTDTQDEAQKNKNGEENKQEKLYSELVARKNLKAKDIKTLLELLKQLDFLIELKINTHNIDQYCNSGKINSILGNIGKQTGLIGWNEDDLHCIRNNYGYVNRFKNVKKDKSIREKGIDFEKLAHLSDLFSDNYAEKKERDKLLKEGCVDIVKDLEILRNKVHHIIHVEAVTVLDLLDNESQVNCNRIILDKKSNFKGNLKYSILFASILNDMRCVKKIISELSEEDFQNLDLDHKKENRYYFARIMVIIGELSKEISRIFKPNGASISSLLTAVAKFRDGVKTKPASIFRGGKKLQASENFFKIHRNNLLEVYKFILNTIENAVNNTQSIFKSAWEHCVFLSENSIDIKFLEEQVEKLNKQARIIIKMKDSEENDNKGKSTPVNPLVVMEKVNSSPEKKEDKKSSDERVEIKSCIKSLAGFYKAEQAFIKEKEKSLQVNKNIGNLNRMKKKYNELYKALPEEEKKNYPDSADKKEDIFIKAESFKPKAKLDSQEKQQGKTAHQEEKRDSHSDFNVHQKIDRCIESIKKETKFQMKLYQDQQKVGKSKILSYAIAQSIGFMGEDIKTLLKKSNTPGYFNLIFYEEWQNSMRNTLRVRHKMVMHGIFSNNESHLSKLVREDIVPWLDDIEAADIISRFSPLFNDPSNLLFKRPFATNLMSSHPHINASNLANHLGLAYTRLGQYKEAETAFLHAIEGYTENSFEKTQTMNILADVYRIQNKYKASLELLKKILEIREKIFEPIDFRVAEILTNIGILYDYLGEVELAIQHFIKAHDIPISDSSFAANILYALAVVYGKKSDYSNAMHCCQQALEKLKLNDSLDIQYNLLFTIATLYLQESQYPNAQKYVEKCTILYEDNVDFFRKKFGETNVLKKIELQDLNGQICFHIGAYQEAIQIWNKTLGVRERKFGKDFFRKGENLYRIGLAYLFDNDLGSAKTNLDGARDFFERDFGNKDPNITKVMDALSRVSLMLEDKTDNAERLCKEAIKIINDSGKIDTFREFLGQLYCLYSEIFLKKNDFPQAIKYIDYSFDEYRKVYMDKPNSKTDKLYFQLGEIYFKQDKYEFAEKYFILALNMQNTIYGSLDHIDMIKTRHALAIVEYCQNKKEAKSRFEEIIKHIEKREERGYLKILEECFSYLAIIYGKENKFNEALEFSKKWFLIATRLYGNKLSSISNMADLFALGNLYFHVGKELFKAKFYLKKLLTLYKEKLDKDSLKKTQIMLGKIYQMKGEDYIKRGKQELAALEYQKACLIYKEAGETLSAYQCYIKYKRNLKKSWTTEIESRLLKLYENRVIMDGVPSVDSILIITFTNKPELFGQLKCYMETILNIINPHVVINDQDQKIYLKIPVSKFIILLPAVSSLSPSATITQSILTATTTSVPSEEKNQDKISSDIVLRTASRDARTDAVAASALVARAASGAAAVSSGNVGKPVPLPQQAQAAAATATTVGQQAASQPANATTTGSIAASMARSVVQ